MEGALETGKPVIGNGWIVTADGEVLTYSRTDQFKTTAYTHLDAGCDMIIANGQNPELLYDIVNGKLEGYTRFFAEAKA